MHFTFRKPIKWFLMDIWWALHELKYTKWIVKCINYISWFNVKYKQHILKPHSCKFITMVNKLSCNSEKDTKILNKNIKYQIQFARLRVEKCFLIDKRVLVHGRNWIRVSTKSFKRWFFIIFFLYVLTPLVSYE